jgi:class 3 adenylate cyclase
MDGWGAADRLGEDLSREEAAMAVAETVNAKYVFLDIVGYSRSRTIEAQSHIIETLNTVIRESVAEFKIPAEKILLLPTGDGVGIALIDCQRPFDIDVRLALELLKRLDAHNASESEQQRRFKIRIGVNENIDNLVTDVNGNRNVTGLGINQAQRIMNAGDGGNILVGRVVAERLTQRDQYQGKLRDMNFTVKHGVELRVCQLVDASIPYLNSFEPSPVGGGEDRRISEYLANYMGLVIKHNLFVRSHLAPRQAVALVPLFALMALDTVEPLRKPGENRVPYAIAGDLPGLHAYYEAIDVWVLEAFVRWFIASNIEPEFSGLFEGRPRCLLVSDEGRRVLARDWPQVVKSLGIADKL